MTDDFLDGKFECFLLGVLLGSVYGLTIGPNEGIGLVKTLGALGGILLDKYDANGNTCGNFEGFWLGD